MAEATLNKQPIFTATPILVSLGTDIQRNAGTTYKTDKCTTIYNDTTTYGSLISKITVKGNAGVGSKISTKRVDLYVSLDEDATQFGVYQSQFMVGTTIAEDTREIPTVVFEFPEGLVVKPGKKLALSATENYDHSGETGDYLSIVVEGGTYDQPV